MTKSPNPLRWLDSSPEVIRLVVMMYVRSTRCGHSASLYSRQDPDNGRQFSRYWSAASGLGRSGPALRWGPIGTAFGVLTKVSPPEQGSQRATSWL